MKFVFGDGRRNIKESHKRLKAVGLRISMHMIVGKFFQRYPCLSNDARVAMAVQITATSGSFQEFVVDPKPSRSHSLK